MNYAFLHVINLNYANMTKHYDEFFSEPGKIRNDYIKFYNWFLKQGKSSIKKRISLAENIFRTSGITFNTYVNDEKADERVIPFDIIPRIISRKEWEGIELGIIQRVHALNIFLQDIYSNQKILKNKIIHKELIFNNDSFLPQMIGIKIPKNIYSHISGIDIIKVDSSEFYVLEDNLRVPSGISYMLENRETMMHLFQNYFQSKNKRYKVLSFRFNKVSSRLFARKHQKDPSIALLTPGIFNSAYFDMLFLRTKYQLN